MTTFRGLPQGTRIVVTDPASPIHCMRGSLWRPRKADDMAWFAMDEAIPANLSSFPDGDNRRNHVKLWPDQCELTSMSAPKSRSPTMPEPAEPPSNEIALAIRYLADKVAEHTRQMERLANAALWIWEIEDKKSKGRPTGPMF